MQRPQALLVALDHPDPVLLAQPRHQRVANVVAARPELGGQLLGRRVQRADVEVAVEEVADLLVRHQRRDAVAAELAELFEGVPVAAVHRDDGLGQTAAGR